MDIDWSKAHDDAEFGACGGARGWSDAWYKKVGDQWFCQLMNRNDKWEPNSGPHGREDLESRPAQPWTGEGLPPVGTVCELSKPQKFTQGTRLEEFPEGTRVLVGGHANFGGSDLAAVIISGTHFTGTTTPALLRQIRTPEQIAEDAKKAHVDIMFKIVTGTPNTIYDGVEALYDAGCRIKVAP